MLILPNFCFFGVLTNLNWDKFQGMGWKKGSGFCLLDSLKLTHAQVSVPDKKLEEIERKNEMNEEVTEFSCKEEHDDEPITECICKY